MDVVYLPEPNYNLDFSLMQALKERRSKRKLTNKSLNLNQISDILWAACGETKKAKGKTRNKRTIASACNSKKASLMIALESGVYSYNEVEHSLIPVVDIDVRQEILRQKMLRNNAAVLIYIGRKELQSGIIKHNDEMNTLLVGTEVGAMSQNVYLYCAAANLNTVLVALYERDKLTEMLGLDETQGIIYVQVIG